MGDNDGPAEAPASLDLTLEPADARLPHEVLTTPYDPKDDAEYFVYDPGPAREKVRGRIALYLFALLAGTILAVFLLLWLGVVDVEGAKELLAVLVSPLVGLVGAATGFYYGGKD